MNFLGFRTAALAFALSASTQVFAQDMPETQEPAAGEMAPMQAPAEMKEAREKLHQDRKELRAKRQAVREDARKLHKMRAERRQKARQVHHK